MNRRLTDDQTFDLFRGSGMARGSDPETAHAAAESVDAHGLQLLVLEALNRLGAQGATSYELARLTAIDRVTISPRLRPLADKGLIVDSGERRPGPTGKAGIVWKAVMQ